MLSRFHRIPERNGRIDGRTDRQTDRIVISISRVSMMTRDNNKNLAIANRPCVICVHNTSRAFTPNYPVTLKSRLRVTQGHWKRNRWIDYTRLTISRVIWRWIISWPWNLALKSLKVIESCAIRKLGCGFLSPSIVTMVVCDIFSVKELWDLKNRARVHSRSLEMAPFDRSHTSSY